MMDRPDALGLIEQAGRSVRALLPALSGAERYEGLMLANALSIAARELRDGGALAATIERELAPLAEGRDVGERARALASAIRAGRHDGEAGVHQALERIARERLAQANPKVLGSGE